MSKQNSQTYLQPGTILDRKYLIEECIASGGFGNTYLVTHKSLDKKFVIKEYFIKDICKRDHDSVNVSIGVDSNERLFNTYKRKFKKEAQRLVNLNNEHIVKAHDLFDENNTSYYVMDYIQGKSLRQMLSEKNKPLDEAKVVNIICQVLEALEVTHQSGLLHMDIKPGNIMMDYSDKCILIDFGASKQSAIDESKTVTSSIAYSAGYAPSEQVNGNKEKWGTWTDFYALGATAYNLLTNQRPPLTEDLLDDTFYISKELGNVSKEMKYLVNWLMNLSIKKRPQSVQEIKDYIQRNWGNTLKQFSKDSIQDTLVSPKLSVITKQEQKQISENTLVFSSEETIKQQQGKNINHKSRIKLIKVIGVIAGIIIAFIFSYLGIRKIIHETEKTEVIESKDPFDRNDENQVSNGDYSENINIESEEEIESEETALHSRQNSNSNTTDNILNQSKENKNTVINKNTPTKPNVKEKKKATDDIKIKKHTDYNKQVDNNSNENDIEQKKRKAIDEELKRADIDALL